MNDKLTSYPAHKALADFRTDHRDDGRERVFELDPIEIVKEHNSMLQAQQHSKAMIRELVEALQRIADWRKPSGGMTLGDLRDNPIQIALTAINRANQLLQGEE